MTNQHPHPITPPPELVLQWADALSMHPDREVFTTIAQWGADQELEACCEWLDNEIGAIDPEDLRVARRPKAPSPKAPSLKEQALDLIDECTDPEGDYLDDNALSIIRRALEALPDDINEQS